MSQENFSTSLNANDYMEPNQMTIDAELMDSQVNDLNLGEVFEEE